MPDRIINDATREINGQLYTWQPSTALKELMDYRGLSREEAAREMGLSDEQLAEYDTPGTGQGSWVPASYKNEHGTFGPSWLLPAMIAGPAIASGIGAAFGAGAGAGAGGGSAAASVAAPTTTATTGGGGMGIGNTILGAAKGYFGGGGTAGTIGRAVNAATEIAAQQAASRAAGRQAEAQNAVLQNNEDLMRAEAQQRAALDAADLDIKRKSFAMTAPAFRTGQVALGDLFSGLQDIHLNIPGVENSYSVTGGIRPSLLTDLSRQAGGELSKKALAALLSGSDTQFDPLPKFELPDKMTAPQPGKLDKALNILGTVGSYAGAISKGVAKPTSTGQGVPTSTTGRTISMPANTFAPRRFY